MGVEITKEEVRAIVKEEVKNITSTPRPTKLHLNMDEAVRYLNGSGYAITKGTLYNYTSSGKIEFNRFGGRRITFTKKQLDKFMEKQLMHGKNGNR